MAFWGTTLVALRLAFAMLDPIDPLIYEFCFPGALTGEAEITCPYCNALLTVPVNDPNGEESYQCCQCQKGFGVDWASGQVTASANVTISLTFQDENKDAKQ